MRFFVPFGALCAAACNLSVVFPSDTGTTPSTPSSETGTPPTTGETGIEEFEHAVIDEGTLCWNCHENDRKDALHYGDPDPTRAWDCGPCHNTVSWSDGAWQHPVKTPHGTSSSLTPTSPSDWIVACSACHTEPADFAQFECLACHVAEDPNFVPHYNAADDECLACHASGEVF